MSPFAIGIAVFFLAAGACAALYFAISPQSRAVDERFADLAVKMRASQGALDGDLQDDNLLRMLSDGPPSASRHRTWILPPARSSSRLWRRLDF